MRLGVTKVASVTQLYTLVKLNERALLKKMNVPSIPALKDAELCEFETSLGEAGRKMLFSIHETS